MDISKIQTLIAQGKVITDVTQIDPDQASDTCINSYISFEI